MMKIENKFLLNKNERNKIMKHQFLYLFSFVLLKYLTNWLNIIFSFIFPIVWLIAGYFIWAKNNHDYGAMSFLMFYTSYSLMPMASLGLMSLPMTLGMDRISNILKIYAVFNVPPWKYFLSNYLILLIQFIFIFNIILLVGNFGLMTHLPLNEYATGLQLHTDANYLLISAQQYFSFFFTNIYIFTVCFCISLALSHIGKRWLTLYMLLNIVYYVNLFLSGTMIPVYAFDPNGLTHPNKLWFKWIQYCTPLGCGARLLWNISSPIYWTWNSDWLCFLLPLLEILVSLLTVYKLKSVWRAHKTVLKKDIYETNILDIPVHYEVYGNNLPLNKDKHVPLTININYDLYSYLIKEANKDSVDLKDKVINILDEYCNEHIY